MNNRSPDEGEASNPLTTLTNSDSDSGGAAAASPAQRRQHSSLVALSALLGVKFSFAEFAIGHPFDAVKTKLQAQGTSPHQPGYFTARGQIKAILRDEGLRGFYRGGMANLARMMAKNAYRTPARPALKSTFTRMVPDSSTTRGKLAVNSLTGLSLATMDAVLLTPLERMKVWLMTVPRGGPSLSVQFRAWVASGALFGQLSRGMAPNIMRASSSWGCYLTVEESVDDAVKRSLYFAGQHWLMGEIARSLATGIFGGGFHVAATMPFDNCKTQFQKHGSREVRARGATARVLLRIYRERGLLAGVYAGWTVRLPHYVVVGAVQAQLIPRIDAMWGLR